MTHPGGRPTDYRQEYCEQIVSMRKKGMIIEQICRDWDISTSTIYLWGKEHEEFSRALARAKQAYHAWYYEKLLENLRTPKDVKVNERLFGLLAAWQLQLSDKPTENPRDIDENFGDSLEDQRKAAKRELKAKRITFKEYADWMAAIASEAIIIEKTEQEKRLQEIEKKVNK